uniref:Uncharacterized protein n=1 Tax=Periophthalmus magnuspinnatus TaxID=409849 RepID=A0A3B3ZWQ8_9GOBI
ICSLYLFSCTIQGNIFINYFLNTGFLVSIWRREFHQLPQFFNIIKLAVLVTKKCFNLYSSYILAAVLTPKTTKYPRDSTHRKGEKRNS